MKNNVGLDFGTSNSAIGYFDIQSGVNLTDFGDSKYCPSTIFYDHEDSMVYFGQDAIDGYIDGNEGRMIWSPKNILGTDLMNDRTVIFNRRMQFREIIADLIGHIFLCYEIHNNARPQNVVCGRPVFFNDDDSDLDSEAQDLLTDIIKRNGANEVIFEYEPIAAAISYEQLISKEKIALIVDMGGGTSDFTIIKLKPNQSSDLKDRRSDILSVGGVHIAGTSFDQSLSYSSVMPELGLGTNYTSMFKKVLEIPSPIYRTLTTWHKINFAYSNENVQFVEDKLLSAHDKPKLKRLLDVLESRYGHALAKLVESAKIRLTRNESTNLTTNGLLDDFSVQLTNSGFEEAIRKHVLNIVNSVSETIRTSGLTSEDIDVVFFTGGSSQIPLVRSSILSLFDNIDIASGDNFGSVATGLSIISNDYF